MKRLLSLILAVLMVAALFAGCAAKPAEKKILKMGLDDAFPPMGYRDDKGNLVGFDIDLATEVCKRMGYELQLVPINWTLKQQELDAGNVDCLWNGYTITEERLEDNSITSPYMKNRQILVVQAGAEVASLEELAGKKLALQDGSSAADALNSAPDFKATLGEVLLYDDNNKALMDLVSGGCDAVLMDEVVANHYANNEKNCVVTDLSLADEEYGIGFRKADTALRDAVEKALKDMAKDGKLAEISTAWFGKDVTTIK